MGCPHRCTFCNQHTITGISFSFEAVRQTIRTGIESQRRGERRTEVAFFGGNFSSLPRFLQQKLLDMVEPYLSAGTVHSIRISTRPDALPPEELSFLKEHGVSTIELGAQSLDPEVLGLSRRGHGPEAVVEAVAACREYGFATGVQLMIGLPGDDGAASLLTARRASDLDISMVRIYPALVLQDTELARLMYQTHYRPFSLDRAVDVCAEMAMMFEAKGIKVIRMGLQDTDSLRSGIVAGPHHPAFGHLVQSSIWLKKVVKTLGKEAMSKERIVVSVAVGRGPVARGQRNGNVSELKRRYGFREVEIREDSRLLREEVRFEY